LASDPSEGDVVATRPDGSNVLRYAISSPQASFTGNQLLDGPLYAGEGVGAIRDVPTAGDLVHRLWRECEAS
jgi:nitronate monooxygenase